MKNCKCDPDSWMDLVKPQICESYEESGNGFCSNCVHDKACHEFDKNETDEQLIKV
jgi:hypothetical protein